MEATSEDELMAGTTSSVTDSSQIPEAIRKLMQPATSSEGPKNDLGKDDFLKLMLTELKYQDPMNTKNDKDFIAQLAQFSSLEQTTKLADNMGATMQFQQLSQVSGLVGMPVEVNDFVNGKYRIGLIEEARMVDGKVKVKLTGNDTMYDPTEIRSVIHPGKVEPAGNTTNSGTSGTAADNSTVQTAVSGQ
jgi:flagellar basal-body rod modification protein FlgD